MKKLFIIGASLLSIFTAQGAFASCGAGFCGNNMGPGCCDDGCPPDQPTNECFCRFVRYQPCYYTTKRCIEEQIPCTKKCCRWIPQYYQVQKCRYVPQYYCETHCRQVCDYYDVPDCRTVRRVICEPQVTYVPRYYWKHTCATPCCP